MGKRKLKQVNLNAKCKKCRYADVKAEYKRYSYFLDYGEDILFLQALGEVPNQEAILRTCMKCGYHWLEGCMK